jgi:hypothetical protein
LNYTTQIAIAIGVAVGKTKRIYLVKDRSLKPALTRAQSLLRENMRLIDN